MIGFYMTFAVVSKPDASGHAARLVTRPCGVALVSNTNSNSLDSSIGIESSLSLVVYLMLKIQLMIELFSQSVVSHYTTSEKFLVTCDSGDYSNLAQFRFYWPGLIWNDLLVTSYLQLHLHCLLHRWIITAARKTECSSNTSYNWHARLLVDSFRAGIDAVVPIKLVWSWKLAYWFRFEPSCGQAIDTTQGLNVVKSQKASFELEVFPRVCQFRQTKWWTLHSYGYVLSRWELGFY